MSYLDKSSHLPLSVRHYNQYNYPKKCTVSNTNETPNEKFLTLQKILTREYATFFNPLRKEYYSKNVQFLDPLNNLDGIDKYQSNIDMLGGRTTIGSILFKDASISLHNIEILSKNQLQTRWTLQVTFKFLPWQPRPKFTGISVYTINDEGIIIKQEDFWDSINLKQGMYSKVGFTDAINDFLDQLKQESGAEMVAPELPYELLRRSKLYEVRRYPAFLGIETAYEQRPEGYDRLGSYCGGSNVNDEKVKYFSPTIMRINDINGKREKKMSWPMAFVTPGESITKILPEPTINKINFADYPSKVIAVTRFEVAATEPVVRGYTKQLLNSLKSDDLLPCSAAEEGECIVVQFDALFSINKRRNEVWVELDDHPWK
eukprot:gene14416-19347_t